MFKRLGSSLLFICLLIAGTASAQVIDFVGGDGVRPNDSIFVPADNSPYESVKAYTESGVSMVMEPVDATLLLGDYYGVTESVIHGHWPYGGGTMTGIRFALESGDPFDLNYYVLTSNTQTGGGAATGNEMTYIVASQDGSTESFRALLPPEDWGINDGYTEVYLGSEFDGIRAFWFETEGDTYCFGMDKFYINTEAPPPTTDDPVIIGEQATPVPVLSTWALGLMAAVLVMGGILFARRRA